MHKILAIMENNVITGRKHEQAIIRNYLDNRKSELVAIYGRRRVGKTYLVKSMFANQFDFSFTGMYDVTRAIHLSLFQKTLEKYSGKRVLRLNNWFDAFDALRDYLDTLEKERIVVFLDEIPWMDTPKSNFLVAFSHMCDTVHISRQEESRNRIDDSGILGELLILILHFSHSLTPGLHGPLPLRARPWPELTTAVRGGCTPWSW